MATLHHHASRNPHYQGEVSIDTPSCHRCQRCFVADPSSDQVPLSSSTCCHSVCRGCVHLGLGMIMSNPHSWSLVPFSIPCPICGEPNAFASQKQSVNMALAQAITILNNYREENADQRHTIEQLQRHRQPPVQRKQDRSLENHEYDEILNNSHDDELARWHPPESDDEDDEEDEEEESPAAVQTAPASNRARRKTSDKESAPSNRRSTRGNWYQRVKELQAFKEENGHCRVPQSYKPNPQLGYWIGNIRKFYRAKQENKPSTLTNEQIKELEDIGFQWFIVPGGITDWKQRMQELKEFREKHGHLRIPGIYPPNKSLGHWAGDMRKEYKLYKQSKPSRLNPERMKDLEEHGFVFDMLRSTDKKTWDDRFKDLKDFCDTHHYSCVPKKTHGLLADWTSQQRLLYERLQSGQKSNMTPEKIAKLNSIDFDWDAKDAIWKYRFHQLKRFKGELGHCRASQQHNATHRGLAKWVRKQRKLYSQTSGMEPSDPNDGELKRFTLGKIKLLEDLGFEWHPGRDREGKFRNEAHDVATLAGLGATGTASKAAATAAKKKGGRPSQSAATATRKKRTRASQSATDGSSPKRKRGRPRKDKTAPSPTVAHGTAPLQSKKGRPKTTTHTAATTNKLARVAPSGKPKKTVDPRSWEGRFQQLKFFFNTHNHVNVYKQSNPDLRMWLEVQRSEYEKMQGGTKSSLTAVRATLLNSIVSDWWDAEDSTWREQYSLLRRFKTKHGHCRVTSEAEAAYRNLKSWVDKQRELKQRTLSREKRGKSHHTAHDPQLKKFTAWRVKMLDGLGFEW